MQKSVAIIGGGPAGMALALQLDPAQYQVTIYEKNKGLGRKFLVAGKGGFNLTHASQMPSFINQYTPKDFLRSSLQFFDNEQFRAWLKSIGIPTFVGTSKRVFPEKGTKPIEVLNAIKKALVDHNVQINYDHEWSGWEEDQLTFKNQDSIKADIFVFALGGGSWKITGSDGHWLSAFKKANIDTIPFSPSNCAFEIQWPQSFITTHEGKPLKNIAISCSGKSAKGEVVLTKFGIEGNAVYALSPWIRKELLTSGMAKILIDLKPTLTEETILTKLSHPSKKNNSESLKKQLKLSSEQRGLLRYFVSKTDFLNIKKLAKYIKALPLQIINTAPLDEAISTVGGIGLQAVDANFQLKTKPGTYCIGEMLDWDAPTGGYLLQACFSMGFKLANHLNENSK